MTNFLDNVKVSNGAPKKKQRAKNVAALWRDWCEATNRPDLEEIVEEVNEELDHWLQEGYSYEELSDVVVCASALKPAKNDRHDVKRLIRALRDESVENEARQLYSDTKRESYEYEPSFAKLKMSRADLAEILHNEEEEWSDDEDDAALWLITHMDAEKATELRDDIESAGYWDGALLPSEFIDFKRKRKWRESIANSSTSKHSSRSHRASSSYSSGKREAVLLEDIRFSLDPAAELLYSETRSLQKTADFHESAPEGYWNSVAELVDEDDVSLERAYDDLVLVFDWHPTDRSE